MVTQESLAFNPIAWLSFSFRVSPHLNHLLLLSNSLFIFIELDSPSSLWPNWICTLWFGACASVCWPQQRAAPVAVYPVRSCDNRHSSHFAPGLSNEVFIGFCGLYIQNHIIKLTRVAARWCEIQWKHNVEQNWKCPKKFIFECKTKLHGTTIVRKCLLQEEKIGADSQPNTWITCEVQVQTLQRILALHTRFWVKSKLHKVNT